MKSILIKNARFLICSPFKILENGAVYVEGNRIEEVGSTESIRKDADIVIDAKDKIVMPGLVDAHTHIGEAHMFALFGYLKSPLTGIADALERVVWPAYVWMSEESTYDMEMFGFLNLLKHGTTTCCDAFMFPDASAKAAIDSGLRVEVAPTLITSIRLPDAKSPEDALRNIEESIKKWNGAAEGRIRFRVHPSATYNCYEWFLKECVKIAKKYDVGLATHVAESVDEKQRADQVWPQGEIKRTYDLGLMGPKSIFFHSCILNAEEIALYKETDTKVAHCPLTNSILGNVAWVPKMLAEGVTVGLGTDMPTNDLFNVMRIVSEIHNIMPREPRGLLPWQPFEMATIGGAKALNLEKDIGTIEVGKKADIITLNLKENTRLFPPTSSFLLTLLTINGSGNDVSDVIVDGKLLMRDRKVLHLDESKIIENAHKWTEKFLKYYEEKVAKGEPLIEKVHPEFLP
ncbi:MAG: amidohydrolase family protein [Candidatus Bathyarchaeia archaeon]